MGTLNSNPTAAAAFDGQVFKKGLDLTRSIIKMDDGTQVVNPTATVRPGMIVTRDANGFIAPATGLDTYGIAKWGKDNFGVSVQVDLPLILNGTTVTNLTVNGVGRGTVSNVTVRSAPNMGGSLFVGGGTDYTINAGNGTIVRVALGGIADGATVFVTFTYALVDADYQFDGRFFQNQDVDRTAFQDGRITIITDWSRVFTVEWASGVGVATGLTFTLTGATSKLFCDALGKFTNVAANDFVGRVYQIPTNQDPYMGVTAGGNPTP